MPVQLLSTGGSMMLWGCVVASSREKIWKVKGRMDLVKCQQILETNNTTKNNKVEEKDGFYMALKTP